MNMAQIASGLACIAGVAACVAPAATSQEAPASETRLLVKLAWPSGDEAAIARQASVVAGVPARYIAGTSPQWHALALRCRPGAECDGALQRLRADVATFEAIQLDERKRATAP